MSKAKFKRTLVQTTRATVHPAEEPTTPSIVWFIIITCLILAALCLGFPQFHYTTALMVAAILRYKDTPGDIFTPVLSEERR